MLLRQISSFKAVTVEGGNWINPRYQQKFHQKRQAVRQISEGAGLLARSLRNC
jgi:hypothetical protein